MLNHNPVAFVLLYLSVAGVVIVVPPLRDAIIVIAKVMAAVAFIAFVFCVCFEIWNNYQRKNQGAKQ